MAVVVAEVFGGSTVFCGEYALAVDAKADETMQCCYKGSLW